MQTQFFAFLLSLSAVPLVAQTAVPATSVLAPLPANRDVWGNLSDLVGRDFTLGGALVTFRWIEDKGHVELVLWPALGSRTTVRLQHDPNDGVLDMLDGGIFGVGSVGRVQAAADGTLSIVKSSGRSVPWLTGDPISGYRINEVPLVPVASGSKQAARVERLIAEGKLIPGAPMMQTAARDAGYAAPVPVRQSAVTAVTQAEAEFEPEPEPAPEIDPETGAVKQTPAGAIRFLDTLAQQGALTILHLWNLGQGTEVYSKIEQVRRKSDCQAVLFGRPDRISSETGKSYQAGTPEFAHVIKQVSKDSLFGFPPYAADWSKVLSVSYGGLSTSAPNDEQTVLVNGPSGMELALRLPDRALAKRAHYAITFLREACDRTAETGF